MGEFSLLDVNVLKFLRTYPEGCEEKDIIEAFGENAKAALSELRIAEFAAREAKGDSGSIVEIIAPGGKWKITDDGLYYLKDLESEGKEERQNRTRDIVKIVLASLAIGFALGYLLLFQLWK